MIDSNQQNGGNVVPITAGDESWAFAVASRIGDYVVRARELFGVHLREPTFDLRARGGIAGKAHLERWHLQFNAILLRDNTAHFLKQTIGHEVAHLVVRALYGKRVRPHGVEWKNVMRAFGLDARATHDYDVSRTRQSRSPFVYRCSCRDEIHIGALRHRRATRGVRYFCRGCRAPIRFSHRCN